MNSDASHAMLTDTIALLEAVARGDAQEARHLACRVRDLSWSHALPGLASAAGAFEQSVASGARSEAEMKVALQSVAYEVQMALRQAE